MRVDWFGVADLLATLDERLTEFLCFRCRRHRDDAATPMRQCHWWML